MKLSHAKNIYQQNSLFRPVVLEQNVSSKDVTELEFKWK